MGRSATDSSGNPVSSESSASRLRRSKDGQKDQVAEQVPRARELKEGVYHPWLGVYHPVAEQNPRG